MTPIPLKLTRGGKAAVCALALPATAVQAQFDSSELPELSLRELMNVEITSVLRRPERLAESASALQVITREQIRRSGATSLPEALRLATNLQVAQQNSHEWIITARGFSSDVANKLLVLIDGRSVYSPLFSGVFWDRQNYLLEDIERIEVISGPGGTLWGGNAVNGVINIITRSADQSQGGYVEAAAGSRLEGLGGFRYGGNLGENTFYRVYGQAFERGPETLSNGEEGGDAWEMAQTGFRIDSGGDLDHFTLQGDYYENEGEIPNGGEYNTRGGNLLGRWTRNLASGGNLRLQMYYDYTEFEQFTPHFVLQGMVLAPPGEFRDELDTLHVDFQHQFEVIDGHLVTWGLGYRHMKDEVDNAPALAFYPEDLDQELISAFVQDEIALARDVVLTLGTKVEHNDYTGVEWSPSVRLAWQLAEDQLLWGAVSRAVRIPSRIDRDLSQPSRDYLVVLRGGSDLRSETVIAYELGYRVQTTESLVSSVSTYYNVYDHIRSTSITEGTIIPFYFENNVEGETYGIELALSYQLRDWWQLRGGYNFLENDLEVKSGEFDLNNALNETADPKHQVSLRSSMTIPHGVELDLALRWVDELPVDLNGGLVYVDDYAAMDIRLGWHLNNNIELSLVGQNLFDDHHQEFGEPGPLQEEVGRNAYARVQWRF